MELLANVRAAQFTIESCAPLAGTYFNLSIIVVLFTEYIRQKETKRVKQSLTDLQQLVACHISFPDML